MSRIVVSDGSMLDLGQVMLVMNDSFDRAFGEAWTAPQCAGLLPMPGVWLMLARDGDSVVGFALARMIVREAELLLLAVRRQNQGRGVGRLLLHHFLQTAQSKGAERLHLEVRDGNQAINLYRSAGFEEAGRRKNYYTGADGQIYDALTLSKSLKR